MKKRAIAVLCLIICLFLCGCDNCKIRKWEKALKQDELHLYLIWNVPYYVGNNEYESRISYDFATLSSDDFLYDTLSIEYDVDEDIICKPFQIGKEIQYANEQVWISVLLKCDTQAENFVLTMKYLTVDEEQKSKEYLVDFTQQPLWDAREQTD